MSSLLPAYAAEHVLDGLSEYLTTSFSLAERNTAENLERFLKDPVNGMFHGPYIRTRLPYAPATQWEGLLEWLPEWFVPYRHQAEAFKRLSSLSDGIERRPEPTLVVTGTGSGKTESFLYPILDHCRRERLRGRSGGVKALILYPMNALANDQAARLASLISTEPELAGIRAGIYTGENQGDRMSVSEAGLITDRETMRQSPPDILLTNYKMLDQLLLRDADARIWQKSATTLQYVALDEFHTYDGAQGTDVALLLRRMGLCLKKHQPEGFLNEVEAARPLGKITPVATSATLGSGEKSTEEILHFAHTIFGEELPSDAIVRETTLDIPSWQNTIADFTGVTSTPTSMPSRDVVVAINDEIAHQSAEGTAEHDAIVHRVFCERVFRCNEDVDVAVAAASASELVVKILENTSAPIQLGNANSSSETLVEAVLDAEVHRLPDGGAAEFLSHALTEIAYLRAKFGELHGWNGKKFPGVETHLWVREVSRVDRRVGLGATDSLNDNDAMFRWSDNGIENSYNENYWLPACYCRNCGRSGWMTALAAGGESIEANGKKIRQQSIYNGSLMRPLLDATSEITSGHYRIEDESAGVFWLNVREEQLSTSEPSEEEKEQGGIVPVLTYSGETAEDLAKKQTCPSCGEINSIRYLGSSVATLLSVAISNLFGMGDLDDSEKKSLVFVDSVQDAAHRAGFVQSRARTFAIRTRTRQMVGDTPITLSELPSKLIDSTDQDSSPSRAKFELLPPWVAENQRFRGFWDPHAGKKDRKRATELLRDVLELDLALEFGDRSDLSRSLVSTGALSVGVDVSDAELVEVISELGMLREDSPASQTESLGARDVAWARGILEYMRQAGGIETKLLQSYLKHDGNAYLLNRREASARGIPKFPRGGAPSFPRIGKTLPTEKTDFSVNPLASARGAYARWTASMLKVSTNDAAHLVTSLFKTLADQAIVNAVTTDSGGTIYTLSPSRIVICPEERSEILECSVCQRRLAVDSHGRQLLDGAPCISLGCEGTFGITENHDNYYRRLYHSRNSRTVVAKEHTGLLDSAERVALENEFKKPVDEQNADAPNILVATPTLEMGIDIGDLSTVMLASLPDTVASYVQRVGRAGRLTGNSLVLAMVVGRQKALARLANPTETIGGEVQPPAAFLSAREILHRQFAGYLIDSIDFTQTEVTPRFANSVFGIGGKNLVSELVKRLEAGVEDLVDEFSSTIEGLTRQNVLDELREWVQQGFADQLRKAEKDWREARQVLIGRRKVLEELLDQLEREAETAMADDEIRSKLRKTRAAYKFTRAQLQNSFDSEHWVSALERFGILPNFTLLDDSVEFSVSISRTDATTGEFETEAREYSRGISSALFELAPGATFYAQGIAATVDSVDLGPQNSALEKWRICPSCSYSEIYPGAGEVPNKGPCPQCGEAKFGDISQVKSVVEMRKVSASVDYSRSAITDRFEDRRPTRFERVLSMVIPDGAVGEGWYLADTGFGIQYLPTVELRWLNLGKPAGGARQYLAGTEVEAPMFRVCRECGHIDSEAGANRWQDHKPWCSLRHARDEDTIDFALGRRLQTQGVLMHLPTSVSTTDTNAIPSLIASLKMGFKEYLGGNPNHLDVTSVFTASNGSVRQMLLLHDSIPGGTGYLSQFTDSADIHRLLVKAYNKLRNCECGKTSLKACPHCLLPFTPARNVDVVSRESALATLIKILLDDAHPEDPDAHIPEDSWDGRITEKKPAQSERSELEAMFLEQLRADLKSAGAVVNESTRGLNALWTIRFPNSKLTWKMEEQKKLPGNLGSITTPDFYFDVDGADLDRIAVYVDGVQFHASITHNRVADDIARRNALYADGIVPWSLTMKDLKARQAIVKGNTPNAPSWFVNDFRQPINGKLNLEDSLHTLLLADPMTQLLAILQNPRKRWDILSKAAGLHTLAKASMTPGAFGPLIECGAKGTQLFLDFRVEDGTPNTETWNWFLNLANLFYLNAYAAGRNVINVENVSSSATTTTPSESGVTDAVLETFGDAEETDHDKSVVETIAANGMWAEAIDEYRDDESEVVAALQLMVAAHVIEPSDIGGEINGIPTAVSWPDKRVALVFPGDAQSFSAAVADGWTIIDSDGFTTSAIPESLLS
ncbi:MULTISPECIES: DEAD/DEAH box helicase [Corynebacterium]|uniref:DEAD/DEAH box helicase n=2 Tax=Corynebacterium TaxID=1716 RepID=A0AB38XTX0_CORAY|nr:MULTISPECIES: DEAD/DEAH box helicase [Corynebacterium]MBC6727097.1 hypothetical protein [Corynebacterium amycolatum]MDY7342227.1 DEAD/DEAH box helicase [Corynebacterium amycolatum]OFU54819.1 hypothetical protein HMPREF3122_08460 [Corynebacterium sp. HMSC11H10]QRP16024.1 DEAD/DEAH box helicase [Corynebacterium amycolatum]WET43416.1 DEAD/DEAH box helicase [Corynebacterium amycolatum]